MVVFKFEGTITLTIPYDQLPAGLLGRDAEAVQEWVQAWLKEHAPGLRLDPARVYLPAFTGGEHD
ncbi:MAG: hypothetical protein ACPL3S_02840 [Halothiobacillaceae bacterium]